MTSAPRRMGWAMRGGPLGVTLLASCGAAPPPGGPDAVTASADAATTALECATLETLAPGYEVLPIATSFSAEPPPRGPRPASRAIAPRQVYRRTAVAQYGGAVDDEPPRPTLIAFEFEPGSDQLAGAYCVVQATFDEAGVVTHGHYPITFVPRSADGAGDDFYVIATLGAGSFPIGFDGTAAALTIYVETGDTAYLESYELVTAP